MRTVIGLFGDRTEAMRAYTALQAEGFATTDLDILTNDDPNDAPKLANLRRFVPVPDVDIYLEGVRQGGTVITANVADSEATRAAEILASFKMVNLEQQAREMQIHATVAERERPQYVVMQDAAIDKIIDETVEQVIDKTVDEPHHPVNRSNDTSPEPFQEHTFEILEVDEVVVVGEAPRVVEGVVLGQAIGQKTEPLSSPPRRQEVELEAMPVSQQFSPLQTYDADFRAFYDAHLIGSGATYESLRPAFNYGYGLATREPFRSHSWSAIEADARRLWEMKNPGTWEQHKDIIQYAWARVRGVPT